MTVDSPDFNLHSDLFKIYIFIKDEVLAGGKPILQELGPYYFE